MLMFNAHAAIDRALDNLSKLSRPTFELMKKLEDAIDHRRMEELEKLSNDVMDSVRKDIGDSEPILSQRISSAPSSRSLRKPDTKNKEAARLAKELRKLNNR